MVYDGLASLDRREALLWRKPDAIYGFNLRSVESACTPQGLPPLSLNCAT
jgi:hypothetical protein